MTAFDTLLRDLGEFGLFQKRILFVLCFVALPFGIDVVMVALMTAEQPHRCAIPGYNNDTYTIQDEYHKDLINLTIPHKMDNGVLVYDPCHINVLSGDSEEGNFTGFRQAHCNRWVYDNQYLRSTAVSELDLVCAKHSYRAHLKTSLMLGFFMGSVVATTLSDLFGRKKVLVVANVLEIVAGLLVAWVPQELLLCFAYFLLGTCIITTYISAFVIGMEYTGPRFRYLSGTLLDIVFATGECLAAGVAYLLRDRNIAGTVLLIPVALIFLALWFVPESARWLVRKGRPQEAEKIIAELAKTNKRKPPARITDSLLETDMPQESILIVVKSCGATWRYAVLCFNWFAVSFLYYGITFQGTHIVGNPYLNMFLFCVVEIPAYICDIILLKYIGRRKVLCFAMCFGGLACISTTFPVLYGGSDNGIYILVLQLIGKFAASVCFTTVFTFTSELLPTVIRCRGLGVGSMCARIGSVISAYVPLLAGLVYGPFGTALPSVVFGSVGIVAGLLVILLPETKDRPMPETMEDFNRIIFNMQ